MITILKGAEVYSPEYLGKKDILLLSNRIEGVYDSLDIPNNFAKVNIINADNKLIFPGFIDNHVHIIGGGGEGSFKTRTPEITLSTIIEAGITTLVGCRGTDDICRDMRSLIAKAKALEEEGISTCCYTGSYDIPVRTITESIKGDLMLIDKVIGVGEIALSDHRSSQATYDEFINVVAQARVGGLLAGKSGIVNIHMGDGRRMFEYILKMNNETEIPINQVLPTHINRTKSLLKASVEILNRGGNVDLTTSCDLENLSEDELRASEGLYLLLKENVSEDNITFSSDGNGSMPLIDENGKEKVGICSVKSLYREVVNSIKNYNIDIEKALKVITKNPARILKLENKGEIKRGKDADLVIVEKDTLEIDKVIAKGVLVVDNGKAIIKGTFE